MIFPPEFFDLNLLYAQKIAQVLRRPIDEGLLGYTHLYLSFGLDRCFDPANPIWQAYLAGIRRSDDACAWTHSFYLDRKAKIPPKSLPDPYFGCFSYALWSGNRVRIHFRNAETIDCSPLSQKRMDIRQTELRAMFLYIQEKVENPSTVVGGSWLYNIEAYRRLFPPEFLQTAYVSHDDYQFIALWGQFLDRHGQIRQDLSAHFRKNLAASHSLECVQASFPSQVLRLEGPIEDFYRFYQC